MERKHTGTSRNTTGADTCQNGMQILGRCGSSRRIPPPAPLPSLKKSEESIPIPNNFGKGTSWSSVVQSGIETNSSSHKVSGIQKPNPDVPETVGHNPLDNKPIDKESNIRSWSGVVKAGSKQDVRPESKKQHESCQSVRTVATQERPADKFVTVEGGRGSGAGFVKETTRYDTAARSRRNGPKGKTKNTRSPMHWRSGLKKQTPYQSLNTETKKDIQSQTLSTYARRETKEFQNHSFNEVTLHKRQSASGHVDSEEELLHPPSVLQGGTTYPVTHKTLAQLPGGCTTESKNFFDSVANKLDETDAQRPPMSELTFEQCTESKISVKTANVAEEKIPGLNLRPQSGYMTITKPKLQDLAVLGSDEDNTLLCMPCDREGTTVCAFGYCSNCCEHLCESCFTHHKKATPSRNHVLLDKAAMPVIQYHPTTQSFMDQADVDITYCVRHKDKPLEYFCTKHRQLACSVCVIVDHRLCDIGYIPELAVNSVNSEEYHDTSERMDKTLKMSKEIRKAMTKMVKLSNDSLKGVLPQINHYRQKINERIDKLEEKFKNESEVLRTENEKKLQKTAVACDYIERSVNGISRKVKQLNESDEANKLFMALLISDYILHDHEANISKIQSEEAICQYHFTPDPKFLSQLDDFVSQNSLLESGLSVASETAQGQAASL